MKRFFWNVKVALLFRAKAGLSIRQAWQLATSDDDGFNDGLSPYEVFDNEVSYWGDS